MNLVTKCPLNNKTVSKIECARDCRFAKRKRIELVDVCFSCGLITGHLTLEQLREKEPDKVPKDKQCLKCKLIGSGLPPPKLMVGECQYNKPDFLTRKIKGRDF